MVPDGQGKRGYMQIGSWDAIHVIQVARDILSMKSSITRLTFSSLLLSYVPHDLTNECSCNATGWP